MLKIYFSSASSYRFSYKGLNPKDNFYNGFALCFPNTICVYVNYRRFKPVFFSFSNVQANH